MKSKKKVAANLRRLLRFFNHGERWMKRAYYNGQKTRFCLMGGIVEQGVNNVQRVLERSLPDGCGNLSLVRFNDLETTKWIDIERLIKRAIRSCYPRKKEDINEMYMHFPFMLSTQKRRHK